MKRRPKLSLSERIKIQILLERNISFSEIAREMNRSVSTITREITRNGTFENSIGPICKSKNLVCNKCKKKAYCKSIQFYYNFNEAENKATCRNSSSQNRTTLTPEVVNIIDNIVTPGIRNGQSLHHVYVVNKTLHSLCSESTIRRLIYRRELTVKPHELRQYVRFKRPSKSKPRINLRNIDVLYGRQYDDYLEYVDKNKRMNIVQYDSVIGKRDDNRAILTITFAKYNFQFGILIKKDSPNDVTKKMKKLFRNLGDDNVKKIFPINITDNGFEFSYFNQIELNSSLETLCKTFYTRPYRSNDKAECERNHVLVRYCLPKGKSFNNLTQDKVNEVFSHINSYIRASLNNSSPYDLVFRKYGQEFMDRINIKRIPKEKVRLRQII